MDTLVTTAVHVQTYIAQPMRFRRSRKRRSHELEVAAKPSYAQLAANTADAQLASLAAAGDDAVYDAGHSVPACGLPVGVDFRARCGRSGGYRAGGVRPDVPAALSIPV